MNRDSEWVAALPRAERLRFIAQMSVSPVAPDGHSRSWEERCEIAAARIRQRKAGA